MLIALLPFLLPLYVVRFKLGPLPTTLLEIALLVVFAAWFYRRRWEGLRSAAQTVGHPLLAALGVWILAGAVSVIVAPNHIAALGLWRAYFLEPALVFILAYDALRADRDRALVLRSFAIMLGLLGLWTIIQYFTPGHWTLPAPWNAPPNGIRATGPYSYPNAVALFAVPIAALCFYSAVCHFPNKRRGNPSDLDSRFRSTGSRPELGSTESLRSVEGHGNDSIDRYILWIGFAGGLVSTILAKSDGGLIALVAAAFVTLVIHKKTRWPAVTVAILASGLALSVPQTRNAITDQIFFKQWSGKVRLVMWNETWKMLKDRPLLGAGLGAYRDVIKPYHKATWMEIFMYPHNILFNLWSETGLLGIGAFIAIIALWIRCAGLIALPVVTTILVHGLVDVPYFKNDLAIVFWVLVALTITASHKTTSPHTS